jgi:hypothetical protein
MAMTPVVTFIAITITVLASIAMTVLMFVAIVLIVPILVVIFAVLILAGMVATMVFGSITIVSILVAVFNLIQQMAMIFVVSDMFWHARYMLTLVHSRVAKELPIQGKRKPRKYSLREGIVRLVCKKFSGDRRNVFAVLM